MRLPVSPERPRAWGALLVLCSIAAGPPARAEDPPFSDADILGPDRPRFAIQSLNLRFTHFDQTGSGYQSRAGPLLGAGSEQLTVEQPQIEVVAKQGDSFTHRVWFPVDIVSAASPDAVDVVSRASRLNEAGSIDWTATYQADRATSLFSRVGFHSEENYRSWNIGFGATQGFAQENTVVSASLNQVIDWFDHYELDGQHTGHTSRSATNGNLGVTQLLSPTTIAHANYGLTIQAGELSNTWSSVPLATGDRGREVLPQERQRHALVIRLAQWLPWNGALKGFYRFYGDDWGIRAHTAELELHQRISYFSSLRFTYRVHTQTSADFFTTLGSPGIAKRTADSDLAELDAHTFGVKGAFDIPLASFARSLHFDLGIDRYFRSNDLRVIVYSCGLGFLF